MNPKRLIKSVRLTAMLCGICIPPSPSLNAQCDLTIRNYSKDSIIVGMPRIHYLEKLAPGISVRIDSMETLYMSEPVFVGCKDLDGIWRIIYHRDTFPPESEGLHCGKFNLTVTLDPAIPECNVIIEPYTLYYKAPDKNRLHANRK